MMDKRGFVVRYTNYYKDTDNTEQENDMRKRR